MRKVQPWRQPPSLRMVTLSPAHQTRRLHWHDHAFYELGMVLGGRCDWRLGARQRLKLHTGDVILLRPRASHCEEIVPGETARLAWLGIDFKGTAPAWCHRAIALGDDLAEVAACFDAVHREHHLGDDRARTRIELALQTIVLLIDRRTEKEALPPEIKLNPRQARTVESAAHYFRTNLRDPLSIAQVAAYHSLCPAHFSSLFRRQHGMTPRTFLRRARLERAENLLAESGATLKEIAAQCGFVDAAHLCRAFRERHPVTPGVFRKRARVLSRARRA